MPLMKVFLSSTAADLHDYRRVALDTIHRLEQQGVAMEYFGPSTETPVKECERRARESDVVVCVVAHRYGHVPEKGHGSITGREVVAAHAAGKDILAWIVADEHPWMEKKEQDLLADPAVVADAVRVSEVAEGVAGLLEFKAWLRKTFTVESFTTADDLGRKIAITLANYIRGKSAPAVSRERISIARLPTTGPELFGREPELQILDDAWSNPNTNVVSFIAWGGVGKTALVNHWLKQRMARDNYRGAERVYAWSFFSQGTTERAASADLFIDQALRWFGDSDPSAGNPWDKGERLANYIRQTRTLLILDGLEPLQHPPGPHEGRLKDVALQALLVELAAHQPGLCVISTRATVGDLIEFQNSTVVQSDLEHLPPFAGAQILRSLKVNGDDEELETAARELGGHAFSLRLLGSYLNEVFDGDIRRRKDIENLFDDTRFGDAAERVIAAYERWLGEGVEVSILRLLGLFDRPADLEALDALRNPPAISGLTESLQGLSAREWNQAVAKLRRVELLAEAAPDEGATLDTHPLLREYFKQQLKDTREDSWREANNRLYEYLKGTSKALPETVEEMSPLFAAIAHACSAGRHKDAFHEVYSPRILRRNSHFSLKTLGLFGADLAILSAFFERLWDQPLSSLSDSMQRFALNQAGYDLRALGRSKEAAQSMAMALQRGIAAEDWGNAARASVNLSQLYVIIGDLKDGLRLAKEAKVLAERGRDDSLLTFARASEADALHQLGELDNAINAFRDAEAMQRSRGPDMPLLSSLPGFQYCDLLLELGRFEDAKQHARQTLDWFLYSRPLLEIALDHLSLGRASLLEAQWSGSDDISHAEEFVQRSVEGLRDARTLHHLPRGLLTSAQVHRFKRDFDNAERDLTEVLRIATRGEMDLYITDYHLECARLRLSQGDQNKAREHLATGREMIERLGYHRRDKELVELEEQLG